MHWFEARSAKKRTLVWYDHREQGIEKFTTGIVTDVMMIRLVQKRFSLALHSKQVRQFLERKRRL